MDVVKNSVAGGRNYTDKIEWFSTSWYYWSSTESSSNPGYAWFVYFGNGDTDYYRKSTTRDVRAVLAF